MDGCSVGLRLLYLRLSQIVKLDSSQTWVEITWERGKCSQGYKQANQHKTEQKVLLLLFMYTQDPLMSIQLNQDPIRCHSQSRIQNFIWGGGREGWILKSLGGVWNSPLWHSCCRAKAIRGFSLLILFPMFFTHEIPDSKLLLFHELRQIRNIPGVLNGRMSITPQINWSTCIARSGMGYVFFSFIIPKDTT